MRVLRVFGDLLLRLQLLRLCLPIIKNVISDTPFSPHGITRRASSKDMARTPDVYAIELLELPNDIPIAWTSGKAVSPFSWALILSNVGGETIRG